MISCLNRAQEKNNNNMMHLIIIIILIYLQRSQAGRRWTNDWNEGGETTPVVDNLTFATGTPVSRYHCHPQHEIRSFISPTSHPSCCGYMTWMAGVVAGGYNLCNWLSSMCDIARPRLNDIKMFSTRWSVEVEEEEESGQDNNEGNK